MDVPPARILRTFLEVRTERRLYRQQTYDDRIGNPYVQACKFSRKTASTRRKIFSKDGGQKRRFPMVLSRRIRNKFETI
jgi:hypothetical protein